MWTSTLTNLELTVIELTKREADDSLMYSTAKRPRQRLFYISLAILKLTGTSSVGINELNSGSTG